MSDDPGAPAAPGGAPAIEMALASVEHNVHSAICANCGAQVTGAFCSACGQELNTHRRSIWQLMHEAFREISSFDSRILRTAWALVLRPGELTLAFQEGRTRRYVPALRLYLFVSLVFFVVLATTGIALVQLELTGRSGKVMTAADGTHYAIIPDLKERIPVPDWEARQSGPHYVVQSKLHFFAPVGAYRATLPAAARRQLDEERLHEAGTNEKNSFVARLNAHALRGVGALESDPVAINQPLTQWIPRILFLLLPLYALVLAIFYRRQRKKFFFVDHLVFSLNAHSFAFVAILVAAGLAQFLHSEAIVRLTLAVIGIYILLAMKRFYRQNWFWTVAKFVSVSFVYGVFMLAPALIAALTVSILGF